MEKIFKLKPYNFLKIIVSSHMTITIGQNVFLKQLFVHVKYNLQVLISKNVDDINGTNYSFPHNLIS